MNSIIKLKPYFKYAVNAQDQVNQNLLSGLKLQSYTRNIKCVQIVKSFVFPVVAKLKSSLTGELEQKMSIFQSFLIRKIFFLAAFSILFHVLFIPCISLAYDISLITAKDLNKNLSSFIVLDARPKKLWQEGHIPGSISFSWEDYTRTDEKNISYRLPHPEKIAAIFSEKGISEKIDVVVYGDADKSWGSEAWVCWTLAWLGHKTAIRLLEGGILAWKKENYHIEEGDSKIESTYATYHFSIRSEINVTADVLKQERDHYYIVDTRSFGEWIKSRIPGAIHISWKKFFKGNLRSPLNPEETKKLLANNKIYSDKPIIYYCTGGIRSAYAWLVHELSGLGPAKNFEGGMEAWEKTQIRLARG